MKCGRIESSHPPGPTAVERNLCSAVYDWQRQSFELGRDRGLE